MATLSPLDRLSLRLRLPFRLTPRRSIRLVLLIAVAFFIAEAVRVVVGNNLHWAIPGRVLRSAQFSESAMAETIRKYGVKTVINLRGCSNPADWYVAETRATHSTNTSQEDITLSAYRFPAPQEIKRLIDVFDRSEYPVLIHCRRGSDRTGLAAGVAVLLTEGNDLATARGQVSVRYGHFRFMHTARMDEFFDFYEADLKERGETHTPERFRDWARNRYRPGPGSAKLELIDLRESYPTNQAVKLTLRARNTSHTPWHFKPGTFAGIQARFILVSAEGKMLVNDRAGMFDAVVPPGESIDLVIGLPPQRTAGIYPLMVDMALNQAVSFVQLGSEPLYVSLVIRD
jgi:protein tyrosine phosphatase (PTP) superfamily phosphohydrolase (DUF442 family)